MNWLLKGIENDSRWRSGLVGGGRGEGVGQVT